MISLSVTIFIITGFLVIFILCVIMIAQNQEFDRRINALASSQIGLCESQKGLSESQISLANGFESLTNDFQELIKEHENLRKKYEFINKAQQQQARANLRKQLLTLVGGSKETATQLIELEKTANPGRSRDWYLKKVILDLQQDKSSCSHT